jgi:hypothetical protein
VRQRVGQSGASGPIATVKRYTIAGVSAAAKRRFSRETISFGGCGFCDR